MATYEYACLACESHFEQRRAMTSSVETALACPECGSDRVRRQFSFLAATGSATGTFDAPSSGGCACGGACACGH